MNNCRSFFLRAGHYCELGTVNPVECPAGTYMPHGVDVNGTLIGSTAGYESDCWECPGGSFCLSMTVTPDPCGVGNYSEPGQSGCLSCEPGYYCDNDTTSYVDMINNKRCPAGLYCGGGLRSLDEATNCSLAKYCPEGKSLTG